MHVERFINKKVLYKGLRFFAVGLLVIPPYLLHPHSSLRAVSALFGNPADCNQGVIPHYSSYKADALVILGSGYKKLADGTMVPSQLGQVRIDSGVIAYDQKLAPLLVLINGYVDDPSEDGMIGVRYLQQAYQSLTHDVNPIPELAIVNAGNTKSNVNTATNTDELEKVVDKRDDIKTVIFVINESNRQRTVFDACERGIPTTSISSESLIQSHNNREQKNRQNLRAVIPQNTQTEQIKLIVRIWDNRSIASTIFFQTFGR